jgi:hypothetical protein
MQKFSRSLMQTRLDMNQYNWKSEVINNFWWKSQISSLKQICSTILYPANRQQAEEAHTETDMTFMYDVILYIVKKPR